MQQEPPVTATRLRAPRAAAIAGIVFSVLLIASIVLLRRSVPADPLEAGAWLRTNSQPIALAMQLVPFAGIAFLWFVGVLRDRLGALGVPILGGLPIGHERDARSVVSGAEVLLDADAGVLTLCKSSEGKGGLKKD